MEKLNNKIQEVKLRLEFWETQEQCYLGLQRAQKLREHLEYLEGLKKEQEELDKKIEEADV